MKIQEGEVHDCFCALRSFCGKRNRLQDTAVSCSRHAASMQQAYLCSMMHEYVSCCNCPVHGIDCSTSCCYICCIVSAGAWIVHVDAAVMSGSQLCT
jgi:hypothetical protein